MINFKVRLKIKAGLFLSKILTIHKKVVKKIISKRKKILNMEKESTKTQVKKPNLSA